MEMNFVLKVSIDRQKEMSIKILDENDKEFVSSETNCEDLAVPLELDPVADRFIGHPVLRERIETVQLLVRALECAQAELTEELKHRLSALILAYQKKTGVPKPDFAKGIGIPFMKFRSICERTSKVILPEVVTLVSRWEKNISKMKEETK